MDAFVCLFVCFSINNDNGKVVIPSSRLKLNFWCRCTGPTGPDRMLLLARHSVDVAFTLKWNDQYNK